MAQQHSGSILAPTGHNNGSWKHTARNGNLRTQKQPKSARVSRRRSKKSGISSGNRSVSFNAGFGRRKLGRRASSSSRSLLLNGKEIARKSSGTSKLQKAPSKLLTPTQYKNHVNKATLGSQSIKRNLVKLRERI